ncbi:MAG: alpha/beta fold hydrolase [Pseudomonadota bacterium]
MRRGLWIWLVILVASNVWRFAAVQSPQLDDGQYAVEVAELNGNSQTGRSIKIAIRAFGNADNDPVLLLHGTPMPSPAMIRLAELLDDHYYVLVPDLPGFGRSTLSLQDYSSITHGHYARELLDALAIPAAHVIGYSQGGAPAIVLASEYPERVTSLTLLAAIGVQELELFGNYTANHAVYAGQLALVTAAQWLLPHFGYLDDAILGKGYARNLTDTDQRVLRPMLRRILSPTLIVHGTNDGLVPFEAAQEHHRLVPQSTLAPLDAGHEIGYGTPELAMPALNAFLADVATGRAATRDTASESRRAAADLPYRATDRSPLTGGALVVLLLAIVVAAYVSEDLTCIASGLMVAQGIVSLPMAIGACLVGLFTSDMALFFVGRWFGAPALKRMISEPAKERATKWLQTRGPLVIILSRFTPGTRLPTYLVAGALKMPTLLFTAYFAIATAIWTPILVTLAATYGAAAERWFNNYAGAAIWFFLGGVVLLWFLIRVVPPLFTWRGRRLALGSWRRMTRFEYWPRWALYAPVILFNIALAIRYRSLTAFALANPAMPLSGVTGESKSAILSALAPSGRVAPFITITTRSATEATEQVDQWLSESGNRYPVVMKPDVGERGRDVRIIHNADEVARYTTSATDTVIAQAMAGGDEFGVLYRRYPNRSEGDITSIAHKGNTLVTGNGHSSLETLILEDDRAVNMAPYFLEAHAAELNEVPASGQKIRLNHIGTHSRGSIFTDECALASEALRQTLDQITSHFEGFHLGRFDLFAPDRSALHDGHSLMIVELNGLTSEPAHIYQPGGSLFAGIRAVCRHWHDAWIIGDQLRKRGARPPGALRMVRELRALWRSR